MFITQSKVDKMKDRISNLEGQVEALTTQKIEERNKKLKEIINLDDKIISLEKDKRNTKNDLDDLKSEKLRGEEEIKHKVKIIMEKHDVELAKKKQTLVEEQVKEIAKIKDEFRDKREEQLEKQSAEMKEMYTEVLEHLTSVSGTLNKPSRVQENGTDK